MRRDVCSGVRGWDERLTTKGLDLMREERLWHWRVGMEGDRGGVREFVRMVWDARKRELEGEILGRGWRVWGMGVHVGEW